MPRLEPTATPESFLQPPAVSSGSLRVVDPDLDSPSTQGWLLSYQRDLWRPGTLEVAYIGRRAQHLYGAYSVNQVEIRGNGFLDAFNLVKSVGESALINQPLAADTRRLATETGSQMMRRLFPTELNLDSSPRSRVRWGRACRAAGPCPTWPVSARSSSSPIHSSWVA